MWHWASTHRSADAILARCGRRHLHADDLGLEISNIKGKTNFCCNLIAQRRRAYKYKATSEKLASCQRSLSNTVYRFGEVFQCGKQIRGNQLAMFSWRYLLLPYISTPLRKHEIATVRILENSAFLKVLFRRGVLEELVSANKSVCWLGYWAKGAPAASQDMLG